MKKVIGGAIVLLFLIGLIGSLFDKDSESNDSASGDALRSSTGAETAKLIEPEAIHIEETGTSFLLGDSVTLKATVLPKEAKDKSVTWSSSDPAVVKIEKNGKLAAVGGGIATITAETSNGLKDALKVTVDGSKRTMKLSVTDIRTDNVNIGDEWSCYNTVNGDYIRGFTDIVVSVGDVLKFYSKYTEEDKKPDVGEVSSSYRVTEEDFSKGFEVKMDLYVTENGGKNQGQSAHFVITYKFQIK